MTSFLADDEMSSAKHFAGSCTCDGELNSGSTATLPIPKAVRPAPLRKVRLLGPAPGVPDPLPATRTPPVSGITMPPSTASGQVIPLPFHMFATEPLRRR